MRYRHFAFVPSLVLVLVACSDGTGAGSPSAPAASPSAQPSTSASGSDVAAQTIAVKLTDALKMDPAQISVKAGQPVKFVVTNTGATDHEFYLGDEAAQLEHGAEMKSMGGMMAHDEDNGIGLKPGETKELVHIFARAGAYLAGCHVDDHYSNGMKAVIVAR